MTKQLLKYLFSCAWSFWNDQVAPVVQKYWIFDGAFGGSCFPRAVVPLPVHDQHAFYRGQLGDIDILKNLLKQRQISTYSSPHSFYMSIMCFFRTKLDPFWQGLFTFFRRRIPVLTRSRWYRSSRAWPRRPADGWATLAPSFRAERFVRLKWTFGQNCYRSPRLQWHWLQWHPAFSDTFGMPQMIGLLLNIFCLQWQSGYNDTFPMSRRVSL